MSYSYEYDESGLVSSYLALSILAPVALYHTYNVLMTIPIRRLQCSCPGCEGRSVDKQMKVKMVTAVLWMIVSYLIHNIRTLKIEDKKGFNPLDILGVEHNTGIKDIKKRLKILLMRYNVNKAKPELKAEYEERQRLINRAYGLVSNKDKYEMWLNNESKSGEIIAIPNVIVRNGVFAFLVYSFLLGIFLPRWAYKKWKGIRDKNRVGVSFKSMELFYDNIDKKMNQMKCSTETLTSLILLMSKSVEFNAYPWKSNIGELKSTIESDFAFPLKDVGDENRGYLVLMDHLFRIHQGDRSDLEYVQKTSLMLIEGMKAIAAGKRYGLLMKHLLVLEAMITQAVFDPKYSMLQFPFVTFEPLFVQEKNKEKVSSVDEYLRSTLDGKRLESAMNVYANMPRVEVSELSASVIDTGKDTSSEDVEDIDEDDVIVKPSDSPSKRTEQDLYVIPDRSVATITVVLNRIRVLPRSHLSESVDTVHAPYIKEDVSVKWMVMLTIDDFICSKVQLLNDFDGNNVVRFNIDTNGLKRVSECKVFVGCGGYLDINVEKSIIIKIE